MIGIDKKDAERFERDRENLFELTRIHDTKYLYEEFSIKNYPLFNKGLLMLLLEYQEIHLSKLCEIKDDKKKKT